MRKLLVSVALATTLLGMFALGFVWPALAVHSVAAHSQLLVDGGPTPNTPVCPGGSSGSCG